jgi:putative copper export protein
MTAGDVVGVALVALVLGGALLLVGEGVFRLWVAPERVASAVRAHLRVGLALAALMIVVGSVGDLASTVARVGRGSTDVATMLDYVGATRHGQSVLARLALAAALVVWALRGPVSLPAARLGHAALSLGLLASISWVSHAGAMGLLPFVGDLAHIAAATVWAGSLAYLAATPVWGHSSLPTMIRRISSLGLGSVAVLIASGVYMSVLHVYGVGALTGTAYGVTLLVKIGLVSVVIGLAGLNRFWFVPLLTRRRPRPLLVAVRVEAVVLALVLLVTALLVTREPAHDPAVQGGHAAHEAVPPSGALAPGAVGEHAGGHAHGAPAPGSVEPVAHPNHVGVPGGMLVLQSSEGGRLLVRNDGPEAISLDLEALSPSGAFLPMRADGADAAVVALAPGDRAAFGFPTTESGVWRLLGLVEPGDDDGAEGAFAGTETFEIAVTRQRETTASGRTVELVLVPAPTLSGGGRTVAFVGVSAGAGVATEDVSVRYRMPGMEHLGDDESVSLERDVVEDAVEQVSGDVALRRTLLALPMAGTWSFTVTVGDEEVTLPIELLAD